MDKTTLYNAITGIDEELLDASLRARPRLVKRKRVWFCAAAAAGLLALIVTVIAVVPNVREAGNAFLVNPPDQGAQEASLIRSSQTITGRQTLVCGDASEIQGGAADMLAPGFYIQTVVEAEVVKVLPDTYYFAAEEYRPCHVAILRVIDRIRGDGLPEEICLRYSYYDTTIFDGYERFILSLQQEGTENYALINETQGRMDYFPDMFRVYAGDLGYGSVIAFRDGKVDAGFWEKANRFVSEIPEGKEMFNDLLDPLKSGYPAARGMTIGKVKSNILKLANDGEGGHVSLGRCDYVTAEDVFASDEAKAIRSYLAPSETNVFASYLSLGEDRVTAYYTRLINGFRTDETIVIGEDHTDGGVSRLGACYSDDDLALVPDIGGVLAAVRLTEQEPPHISVSAGMQLAYADASGVYRKVDGSVYGVVRLRWYYRSPENKNAFLTDDQYYLYDAAGGSVVERDELKQIIGSDPFIQNFPYGSLMVFSR